MRISAENEGRRKKKIRDRRMPEDIGWRNGMAWRDAVISTLGAVWREMAKM